MNTIVKKITNANIDKLVPLFDQYMVFYKKPSAPDKYRQYLAERIRNNDATGFIAFNAHNKAVGFVLHYHTFSSVSLGKVIILNDLFVSQENRQKGVAAQLVEHTITLAKNIGVVRIDLATAIDNKAAQCLYEQLGFAKDSEYFTYRLKT